MRRQRGKCVILATTLICMNWFPYSYVVASLDKALYDDYFYLVALKKQKIQLERSQTSALAAPKLCKKGGRDTEKISKAFWRMDNTQNREALF